MPTANLITPFLCYDGDAERAATLYVSLFPDSRVLSVKSLAPGPAGGAALVEFDLDGQRFTALDGGPTFQFSPAVSFVVSCESQEEIDHYWDGLLEGGGVEEQCGWLRDRFGLSWQIVPEELSDLMERAPGSVVDALLGMVKIDLAQLREAAN